MIYLIITYVIVRIQQTQKNLLHCPLVFNLFLAFFVIYSKHDFVIVGVAGAVVANIVKYLPDFLRGK